MALFLVRAVDGLGFVPGLLATAPFAVAGLVLAWDRRVASPGRDAVLMVVLALPVVWAFQYSGGAVPQWGGRYVLTTTLVASAIGIGASGLLDRWMQFAARRPERRRLLCSGWPGCRTAPMRSVGPPRRSSAVDVPVVSAQDFWLRELGAEYDADTRWLSVDRPEGRP